MIFSTLNDAKKLCMERLQSELLMEGVRNVFSNARFSNDVYNKLHDIVAELTESNAKAKLDELLARPDVPSSMQQDALDQQKHLVPKKDKAGRPPWLGQICHTRDLFEMAVFVSCFDDGLPAYLFMYATKQAVFARVVVQQVVFPCSLVASADWMTNCSCLPRYKFTLEASLTVFPDDECVYVLKDCFWNSLGVIVSGSIPFLLQEFLEEHASKTITEDHER